MILKLLSYFIGGVMILGGLGHFMIPLEFLPLIPAAIPFRMELIYLSGAIEVILGIGALSPISRPVASRLIMWLLILYTPLHVLDLFRATPVVGDHTMALVRLSIQGFLIWVALKVSGRELSRR